MNMAVGIHYSTKAENVNFPDICYHYNELTTDDLIRI